MGTSMNHPEIVESNDFTSTASDTEAVETGYQPTIMDATFHPFLKLPPEIRCRIYEEIASTACRKRGGLNLFKTSTMVRTEGAETSARHCLFFQWYGRWGPFPCNARPPSRFLGLKATNLIQNIRLELNLGGFESGTRRPFDYRHIEYFGGSEIMRELCQITLDYGRKGYVSQHCASEILFKALGKLTGFRFVRIRIVCEEDQRILTTRDDHIMTIRNTPRLHFYALRVKAALEPTLGPATSNRNDEYGLLQEELSFRPFEWKP